jgi:hypothetical protein
MSSVSMQWWHRFSTIAPVHAYVAVVLSSSRVLASFSFRRLASYSEFLKANTWISAVQQETDNEVRLLLGPPGFQMPVTLSVVFDPIKYFQALR